MIYQQYSVLPALQKLTQSPFVKNEKLVQIRQEAAKKQNVFFEHNISEEIYKPICEYIADQTSQPINTFQNLAQNLAEDVIIHRIENKKDWMCAGHICLPSGWWPEEKIGKPLKEIHSPIPGMKDNHFKLVETIINSGPFLRYVWSVVFENKLNFHPSLPKKTFSPDDLVYLKIEEQMTIGFPQIQAALFVLRQNILMPKEIDYPILYLSCKNMTEEQKEYKGISQELLDHLQSLASVVESKNDLERD